MALWAMSGHGRDAHATPRAVRITAPTAVATTVLYLSWAFPQAMTYEPTASKACRGYALLKNA